MIAPDAPLALCRFLQTGAAILPWGAGAYLALLVPQPLAGVIGRRLGGALLASAMLAFVASLAMLPLRTAMIAGGWTDALDPVMLRAVMLETDVGRAWLWQTLAAGLLLLAAWWNRRTAAQHPEKPASLGLTAFAAALLLCTLTISGHAAMHDGALRALHRLNDALHMLAAGAWVGALLPVLMILPRLSRGDETVAAGLALMRFSTAGHVAVALTLVSGLINVALVVGTLPTDWSAPYQMLLCLKIALVAVMVGLALANRYLLVPRLGRHRGMARALGLGTLAELVLAAGVLGLVAWFGMLAPN